MVEKEQLIKEKFEHNGLCDFAALYGFAHNWLKDKDYGVIEEKYAEKVSGNSRNITIEWKASKGLSDYFKMEHKIKFEVEGLTDVEVEIDGTKKKMNKGLVRVEIKGNLLKDPKSKWETSAFYKFLRDVYNKYIIPQRIDTVEDMVKDDVREFKDQLKAFLDLKTRR